MASRGIVGTIVDRLTWSYPRTGLETDVDRGWAARLLAGLFGFGGILLFVTLLLPGPVERDMEALSIVAGVSIAVAIFLLVVFDRLPLWFLHGVPAIATGLVALTIYFTGPEGSATFAMYMAWVVIAAALFLDTRLILVHGGLAVAAYAIVLALLEGSDRLDAQRLIMTAGTVLILAMVMGGVSAQRREVLRRLQAAARTDPLTGLLNRRALEESFEMELSRAGRGNFGVGLVMLDLDGFKAFNDEHGHPAGDAALERLSHVLVHATRAIDHVGRVGGEEFAILAPESTTAGTLALAERLRRAVEIEFSGFGGLTASCGVASYPDNGSDRVALVAAADRALYEAKKRGRNRAVASEAPPRSARRATVAG